ncbi:glycosyltransferase family 39 protein [Candidatus Venteria ishoeyi]|uniref:ArnT family glycosyltransferase n=1 Tax=Candidatus Venteria ishoeyi TaxID=1899563 RepID=UPI0025A4D399|nr:phospholipid carrier-dependent glycosyltransferase [Candidatus Venteria ishoeyi]MDM8547135.1 glycosyltransferase family 39 protein [Candidatus Venteria ishoeyi]
MTDLSKINICYAVIIFCLALFIRIEYFNNTHVYQPLSGDASSYMTYAKNIDIYYIFSKDRENTPPIPDSFWAPAYPFFIVLIHKIAKILEIEFYFILMIAQAILGGLIALLTFLMGRLFLNKHLAFSAALLTVFSPHLISLGNYILTETLFSFTLMLSLYLFMLWIKYKNHYLSIITGLSFGLAYLVNPVIFFAPLFLAILFYYSFIKTDYNKKIILVMLMSFLVIVLSWSLRNHLNVDSSGESSSGRVLANLVVGAHHDFFDIWRKDPRDPNNPATLDLTIAQDSISTFLPLLIDRIIENPSHYAQWYFLEKPYLLWSWNILIGQGDIYVYAVTHSLYTENVVAMMSLSMMKSLHLWLVLFALLGIFFVFKKGEDNNKIEPKILYIVLVYVSAVYVVLQAEPRYSVPLRPEMYLCAMFFISEIVKFYKKLKGSQSCKCFSILNPSPPKLIISIQNIFYRLSCRRFFRN